MIVVMPMEPSIRIELLNIHNTYTIANLQALTELTVEGAFASLTEEWLVYEYFDYWLEANNISELPRVEGLVDRLLPLMLRFAESLQKCMPEQDFIEMAYSTIHRVVLLDDGVLVEYEL